MSVQPFKIRVRIDDKEVELSGSREDVMAALEDLSTIVNKVSDAFSKTATTTTAIHVMTEAKPEGKEVFPTVTIPPDAPCPEVITSLLSTEWGRSKPRTLSDLLEAMKVNAIHYPIGTVKGRLTDLTKRGALRRIRTNEGYGYILLKRSESTFE
jgi:hypothetical protein